MSCEEPRWRCASETCDELILCAGCASARSQSCEACKGSLYRDSASPLALRRRVFSEAFTSSSSELTGCARRAVHPWVMVRRAFEAYAGRPLLSV